MVSHKERLLKYVAENNKCFCDDCLSKILEITPRQTVNIICRKLNDEGVISRCKDTCSFCHKSKIVNCSNSLNHSFEDAKSVLHNNSLQYTEGELSKRLKPDEFESRVGLYLKRKYNQDFEEIALTVGENKVHKFDLVSTDKKIVIECKSYTWTQGNNFPSAKISTALEAVFYLSRIVADKKAIVFKDSLNDKNQSLVDLFIRRYGALLDDIEIWAYYVGESIENDIVNVRREKGPIWYKTLYGN